VSRGRGHPASLLLVHGAGSGPWIFDPWPASFPNLDVRAIDLHEHLDISHASMNDYADRLVEAATELPAPVSICGWSMGGLVAMLAASRLPIAPHSLILIESSPPGEIQGFQPEQELESRSGRFNPQSVYGAFPAGLHARPESLLARAERKRGIPVRRSRARRSSSTAMTSPRIVGDASPVSTAPRYARSRVSTTGISCSTAASAKRSATSTRAALACKRVMQQPLSPAANDSDAGTESCYGDVGKQADPLLARRNRPRRASGATSFHCSSTTVAVLTSRPRDARVRMRGRIRCTRCVSTEPKRWQPARSPSSRAEAHPSLTLREETASALSGLSRARVVGSACDLVPTADLTLTIEETESR
jgi:pimeloyl-ACP methyl ester carboxylesterase